MKLKFALVTLVVCAIVSPPLLAERPRVYALTGGTVVPAPGESIEDGIVVIRDGLIEAVGSGIDVPADAVEIDVVGKWIYPGLIDADYSEPIGIIVHNLREEPVRLAAGTRIAQAVFVRIEFPVLTVAEADMGRSRGGFGI